MKTAMRTILTTLLILCSFTAQAADKPLKIYILAGQSNMQGHAQKSTLPYMARDPKTKALHDKIVDAGGTPRVYEDVRVAYFSDQNKAGPLTVGFGGGGGGGTVLGPELGFGVTMYSALKEPILIIKTAWGGKSLHTDFRPPSAGPNPRTSTKKEETGKYYRLMMAHVKKVLADPKRYCPVYDPKAGYEIAGFVWFQGFNDLSGKRKADDPAGSDPYTQCMAHFIRDVRKDLNSPALPFVIGTIGVGGHKAPSRIKNLAIAQAATGDIPEFKGNVAAIRTGDFWEDALAEAVSNTGKRKRAIQTAHSITKDGTRTPALSGWQSVGVPEPDTRVWRYFSFDPIRTQDKRERRIGRRFRDIALPAGMEKWYAPSFDDSAWSSGTAPIGIGFAKNWKIRGSNAHPKNNSQWGTGEFLLMRTIFELKEMAWESYRLSILAKQGYHVYLNGHKVNTYIWWTKAPLYRAIALDTEKISALLKKGTNTLAAYTPVEYVCAEKDAAKKLDPKNWKPFASVDLDIEGITKEGQEALQAELDKLCSDIDRELAKGASNQGYHYLGSGKMLSQIGEAFAGAILKIKK